MNEEQKEWKKRTELDDDACFGSGMVICLSFHLFILLFISILSFVAILTLLMIKTSYNPVEICFQIETSTECTTVIVYMHSKTKGEMLIKY